MKIYENINKECNSITGVAIANWKQICNRGMDSGERIRLKIKRAVHLGKVTHIYDLEKSHFIVRFFDINILLVDGVVYMVWRDRTRPWIKCDQEERDAFDEAHGLPKKKREN